MCNIVTMPEHKIQTNVEHYFDCPECSALITDGGGEFETDENKNIVCDNCNARITIIDKEN